MKPHSLDDYWELLKYTYEQKGKPLPRRWLWLYRGVRWLLMKGVQ